MVDSVFKNHKPFFIKIGTYLDNYIGSNLSTFCRFLAPKIRFTRQGAAKLDMHQAFICLHVVSKFEHSTFSRFWAMRDLIIFDTKMAVFLGFTAPKSRSRDLEPPKLAYETLFFILMLGLKFSFLVKPFFSYKQIK